MSHYLMGGYGNEERERWKSCVRSKKLDDLPLDVIGGTIAQISVDDYLRWYEASRTKQ